MTALEDIRNHLIELLDAHKSSLKVTADTAEKYEVCGTIPAMQGKKKVDGIYFASVVPKPKDVRFYFFPIYTHKAQIGELPENLQKALKGKSCFHIKKMDDAFQNNLQALVNKAVEIYKEDGLLK